MEPHLAQLSDHQVLRSYQRMSLFDLVWHQPANARLQGLLTEARGQRYELTLAVGIGSLETGRDSKLWHELQNDLTQFRDGWPEMQGSFGGNYVLFDRAVRLSITNSLPNITSLNIMFNCRDFADGEANIGQMLDLVRHYSPRLRQFRLWAAGPSYVPVGGDGWWVRFIANCLVDDLFPAVRQMTNLETLWLDLCERLAPELGDILNWRHPLRLDNLFRNGAAILPRLGEFRYATSSPTTFATVSRLLSPIPNLQSIHICGSPQGFEEWLTIQQDSAWKYREITVGFGHGVRDGLHNAVAPDLDRFFRLFDSLSRVKVTLTQGVRFLSLFRALDQVPHLQVLHVDNYNGPLLTQQEIRLILADRPQPLIALQILVIRNNFRALGCAYISVWPLFGDLPGDRPYQRDVVPNLVCFKMLVVLKCAPVPSTVYSNVERLGVCRRCPIAEHCVMRAINWSWFAAHDGTLFVQGFVQLHDATNGSLVVGDQLSHRKFNDMLHPKELH